MDAGNRLLNAARELQEFCERMRWNFCFIGGIAVLHWGEPRLTRDADVAIYAGIGNEEMFVDALLAKFRSRIKNARDFALRNRVLLLAATNGVPLDISLGALDFEARATTAASAQLIAPGIRLRLCSPSALVVYKVFAGRAQDWLDVEGIITKSRELIDWDEVRRELAPLLEVKNDPSSLSRLEQLLSAG